MERSDLLLLLNVYFSLLSMLIKHVFILFVGRKNASHGEVGVAQRAQLACTNAITGIFCLLRGSIKGRV